MVVLLGTAAGLALVQPLLPTAAPAPSPITLTTYLAVPAAAQSAAGTAVAATVAGRVWEVYFSEGQAVRKGQVLVKVTEKLRTAEQHRLHQLLGQQQLAYQALAAQRPAAPAEAVAAARSRLAATRRQLAHTPTQLSFLFVTAPQDGVVVSRTVAPGDYLAPGTTIATLAAPPTHDATLLLSEAH